MKNFLTLQSVETVLGHLRALPVLPAETVPLTDALGRRLAEALHAPADLPGFDRSTVDGFAVRARDVFGAQEGSPALLECVGDCPMGAVPDISLQPGQCARILTGGMLPEGADCVVMVEYSRPAGGNRCADPGGAAACNNNVIAFRFYMFLFPVHVVRSKIICTFRYSSSEGRRPICAV